MFMVLSHLYPHCSSVQMEPSSSPIKIKSWRDGPKFSALFSTVLHQSMMRQFNAFCMFQSTMNLMHHPLLVKLKRPLVSYQMTRCLGLMQFWLVYKYGGPVLHQKLVDIFQSIWQQGIVPQDFKDALIIHLYKRKGNHQQCDSHHGISLLSITGKVLARVLLNHLTTHLERGLLLESECGFCMG